MAGIGGFGPSSSSKSSQKKFKPTGASTGKKNKLRTSRDVYNRLKWDASSLSIDISKVYIGYKDRFLGMCELPFTEFHPTAEDSDIPYHRIYYFRGGGPAVCPAIGKDGEVQVREHNWPPDVVFYWDRERRMDAIFNSGEGFPPPKRTTRRLNPGLPVANTVPEIFHGCKGYDIVPCYKFNPTTDSWEVNSDYDNSNNYNIQSLKIVSFNILYDLYDTDLIYSAVRWPYLIDALEDKDPDVMALQEVTRPFLALLEAQPWVQAEYYLTDISTSTNSTLNPYGQILLSKIPFQRVFFSDHGGKRYVIGSLELHCEVGDSDSDERILLHMANVHLKSNYRGDSIEIRATQVKDLLESLNGLQMACETQSDLLILGDTNFKAEETIPGLIDARDFLNQDSDENSFTIDILNNALAHRQSRSGNNERYDRIFFKPTNRFQPTGIRVIGKTPIDLSKTPRAVLIDETERNKIDFPLNLSDHYGLECEFQPYVHIPEKNVPKPVPQYTYTSAVALIPPKEIWDPIQAIRSEFDPSFIRWPPHINLIYGFIPDSESNFVEASKLLQASLVQENFQPFQVTLSEIGIFKHGSKTMTVYLTSKNSEELKKLEELETLLRVEYPKSKEERSEFKPHLTIAKLPCQTTKEQLRCEELIQAWKASAGLTNISFRIDQIQLISRVEDKPFEIRHTIYFPEETEFLENFLRVNQLLPSSDGQALRNEALAETQKICGQLSKKIKVQLTGSTLLDIHDDSSDLDILCCGPENFSREDFFKELQNIMKPNDSRLKLDSIVLNAVIPVARLSHSNFSLDLKIDLVYITSPYTSPWDLPEEEICKMTDEIAQCTEGIREARIFLDLIPSKCHSAYRTAVRALKYWAKRRNIYSKTMGFLGSTQISALVAYPIIHHNIQEICAEDLVEQVFYTFSAWDWPKPVKFHANEQNPTQSRVPILMPILSPAYPYSNKCRSVTRSTRGLIKREISRGSQIFLSRCDFRRNWSSLTEDSSDFFSNKAFLTYLSVCVICDWDGNSNGGQARGLLESRLVSLVVGLEDPGTYVQPLPQIFEQFNESESQARATAFIGLTAKPQTLNLRAIEEFKKKFMTWYISSSPSDGGVSAVDIQVDVLNQDEADMKFLKLRTSQ